VEIAWTLIPLGVVVTFFVMGLRAYLQEDTPPANAEVIEAVAFQWGYNFTYPNGGESDRLHLRVNQPVVLQIRSQDVLHALYIPAFRIQRNAVPGRMVEMWFKPTEVGEYPILCTQYCGDGHSLMHSMAEVLNDEPYKKRMEEVADIFTDPVTKTKRSLVQVGQILYTRSGCAGCHSVDGKPNIGPTWKGLYKHDHKFSYATPPGYTLSASDDDAKWVAYLRESILKPDAKVVDSYGPPTSMSSYAAQFSGTEAKEKKLAAMVEYIKSLGPDYRPPVAAGKAGLPPPPPLPPGEGTKDKQK
jgi:cytochrome c oxidase subunit 2